MQSKYRNFSVIPPERLKLRLIICYETTYEIVLDSEIEGIPLNSAFLPCSCRTHIESNLPC